MPKLPVVSAKTLIKFLKRRGFRILRQTGSHIILAKDGVLASVVVPNHPTIATGTLLSILKAAEISRQDFIDAI